MADSKNNTGVDNSGNWNSGDCNSGNWNSGFFNTNEPKLRLFNKDYDLTRTEFDKKFGGFSIYPLLNEWIEKDKMTDEEKKAYPEFGNTGGYLKTYSYKDAWKIAWDKASEADRKWFLDLPNFDADVFFEITGVDVRKQNIGLPSGTVVKVTINGKEHTAIIQWNLLT